MDGAAAGKPIEDVKNLLAVLEPLADHGCTIVVMNTRAPAAW